MRVLRLSGGIRQEQDSLWWKLAGCCCSAVSSVPARSGPALLRRIAQPPPAVQPTRDVKMSTTEKSWKLNLVSELTSNPAHFYAVQNRQTRNSAVSLYERIFTGSENDPKCQISITLRVCGKEASRARTIEACGCP